MGLLYSLTPLLIFPRQEGCEGNGVFARIIALLSLLVMYITIDIIIIIIIRLSLGSSYPDNQLSLIIVINYHHY